MFYLLVVGLLASIGGQCPSSSLILDRRLPPIVDQNTGAYAEMGFLERASTNDWFSLIIASYGFLSLRSSVNGKLFTGVPSVKEKALMVDGKSLKKKCYTYKKPVDAIFRVACF